ncbi:sensor domain-containing diguanylate cyclase [Alloiococcus sp. CFN-8]|uniref:sensor domain-containing diguanylate cyclase n=1 Tax=Alloiococcus sp. CFN-8 TaxID=3416081 RepID=UPI003CFB255A
MEKENKFIYKSILEGRKSVCYYYDLEEKRFLYLSPAIEKVLGWNRDMIYKNFSYLLEAVHPEDLWRLEKNIVGDIDFTKPSILRYKNSKGDYIWTEDDISPVYKNNKLIALTGCLSDISWRKNLEEIITYKDNYDALTGVYNRQYFQWWFERLHKDKNSRIALIICELTGMKSSNNNLGLHKGNNIIKNTAEFLKSYSGEEGMLFRIGGDEFALIYLDIDSDRVNEIIDSIKAQIESYKGEYNIPAAVDIIIAHSYSLSSLGIMDKLMESVTNMINEYKAL